MKRFTETEKWNDPWYRRLPMEVKTLWNYLCDRCDVAGVIELDLELAGLDIGHKYHDSDVELLASRMEKMKGGKWRILKFLEFQYGTLDTKCRGQTNVIKAVLRHGIDYPILHLNDRVSHRVSDTLQDKTGKDRIGQGQEGDRAGARVNSPPGGERSAAEWAEEIRQAYCRGDQPMECQAAIVAELDAGTDPQQMLEKVRACSAAIRKHAPGGPDNRFVPRALKFFTARLWVDHGVFEQQWLPPEKKEGAPPPRPPVNPYEVPPCGEWKKIARRIAERCGGDGEGIDGLDWRQLEAEDRLSVWAEWKKENGGAGA